MRTIKANKFLGKKKNMTFNYYFHASMCDRESIRDEHSDKVYREFKVFIPAILNLLTFGTQV